MLSLTKPNQHIDKETYTNDFKTFTHTYLHKPDMKRIGVTPRVTENLN
jgi:hypothetical protein